MSESANDASLTPVNRHAPTPYELQRAQLAKLLKDPSKPVVLPQGPSEKTIRPPREMMKNVQGSSAGAGSGEFHVYKQNRRREYERIKLMEEAHEKEAATEEFHTKKSQFEAAADAKTAKNRAKRQKRKERSKTSKSGLLHDTEGDEEQTTHTGKKRKLDNQDAQNVIRRGQDWSDGQQQSQDPADLSASLVGTVAAEQEMVIHDEE